MKIHNAIIFATLKHKNQKRKGTNIPYIVHPMEVMQILTENDCSENVIVAGILHDTLEDTDTRPEEIEKEFGKEILERVQSASEDKSQSWKERQPHTIECLKNDTLETKLVCCADKLSNIRSMYADFQNCGADLWKRFNAPKDELAWYYRSITDALADLNSFKMYAELKHTVKTLFGTIN